jgi:dTDP-4-dehydrorhamnose reductase
MKVLVTGANGLLGREVCRELGLRGAEAVPIDIDDVDLCELEPTLRIVEDTAPDAVVHCAAWTDVDACEADPDRAFRANSVAARNAAMASRRVGAKLLHVSTDYVFSGQKEGGYRETDPVGPLSVYGASKEAGERQVREQNADHFILRTAWLYGDNPRCFPATIERLARQFALEGKALRVVDDQRGTPTWSRELARQIVHLLPTEAFGTYHATAQGETSWYGFARRVLESRGIACSVEPCTTAEFPRPAPRPTNSVLDNLFLRIQGLDVLQPWEAAWQEYVGARGARVTSAE